MTFSKEKIEQITNLNHSFLMKKLENFPVLYRHAIKKNELNVFTMAVTEELTQMDDITPLVACLDKYGTEWRVKPTEENNGKVYFVIVRKPVKLDEEKNAR